MSMADRREERLVFTVVCNDGKRYVVYNASEIGNPPDHVPNKWYFWPYPVPLGLATGDPFDTAESAKQAALGSR